tara:strand:- start:140 stop:586 length:447 start_codon:yes stop_codon:yes gene_type:complete
MTSKSDIETDITSAMKAKDEVKLSILRQVKNAIDQAEITNGRAELDEAGLIKILRGEVKKRTEAASDYVKGGRQELADKENNEIEIIQSYLPAEMDEAKIREVVSAVVKESGASGPADFGKVMGVAMAKFEGNVDGGRVGPIVKELLS